MTAAAKITGSGDVRDQHWLDSRIAAIEDGMDAVVEIARNWSEGRNLARLYPGVSAAAYITERVGPLGKAAVPVLFAESNWSNPQIAAVAGVDQSTVYRARQRFADANPDRERGPVLGADNKVYPPRPQAVVIDTATASDDTPWTDLDAVLKSLRAFSTTEPVVAAGAVPERRRAGTARILRSLGTYLGSIALALEGMDQ